MDENLLLSFSELEETHWWFVVRRRIVLEELRRRALEDCREVLEVGCGTGGLLRELSELHPDWTLRGVEPSTAACLLAVERGCDATCATFEGLPADDASLDLLIALDVLEHCEKDSVALAEALRTVRPGGVVLLTVPALPSLWSPHDDLNGHFRRYTRATIAAALVEAGFSPVRVTFFNSLLLPAAWISRKIARWFRLTRTPGLRVPPAPLNAMMKAVFSLEVWWLRVGRLPLGLSLMAVARKDR